MSGVVASDYFDTLSEDGKRAVHCLKDMLRRVYIASKFGGSDVLANLDQLGTSGEGAMQPQDLAATN